MCISPQFLKYQLSSKLYLHGVDSDDISHLISSLFLPHSLSDPATLASLLVIEHDKLISTTGPLHMLSPLPKANFMAKSFLPIGTQLRSHLHREATLSPWIKLLCYHSLLIYALHHLLTYESTLNIYYPAYCLFFPLDEVKESASLVTVVPAACLRGVVPSLVPVKYKSKLRSAS